MPTHYDTLGILRGSSLAEIKAAYRALALKCHPDKAHGLPPIEVSKRESRFKVISSAYEILSDPVRRASYDETIAKTTNTRPMNTASASQSNTKKGSRTKGKSRRGWSPEKDWNSSNTGSWGPGGWDNTTMPPDQPTPEPQFGYPPSPVSSPPPPEELTPSLPDDMGYSTMQEVHLPEYNDPFSFTLRFATRFKVRGVRSDQGGHGATFIGLSDKNRRRMHIVADLERTEGRPGTEDTEDVYFALKSSPAEVTRWDAYFKCHPSSRRCLLIIVIEAGGQPAGYWIKPSPWDYAFMLVPGVQQERNYGIYSVYTGPAGDPLELGGMWKDVEFAVCGEAVEEVALDEAQRKKAVRGGAKTWIKWTAMRMKTYS